MEALGKHDLVTEIVGRALELDGSERSEYVVEACGEDRWLRSEVESLLAQEEAVDEGFLGTPPIFDRIDEPEASEPPPPERLGTYQVIDFLGEGGMGRVYVGEQSEPIQRRVAVKVIDAIHRRSRRRRFTAECQALARLNHPNVASLYEVGTTDDGHPFLAMELIDGAPITRWCDERRIGVTERVRLFLGVCAGVAHAHEKGILHCDIKPGNILVTEVDGWPRAKVIDFGIASALDEPLLTDTPVTQASLRGTPAYMCPEAMDRGAPHDLDTRSDVHGLGLVLYELVTGVLPFQRDRDNLPRLLRRITEDDPPAPSARFRALSPDRQHQLAARRGLDPTALRRRLNGDLDAILLKAVARDKARRYATPGELVADLRRHLSSRPIEARPPSLGYVVGRFVKRRAGAVAVLSLFVLSLAGALVARSVEARRAREAAAQARQAAAEADELSRFLIDLFQGANPERAAAEVVTTGELLARGAERLRTEFLEEPLTRARFLQTIGEIYTEISDLTLAGDLVEEALAIRRDELGETHELTLETLDQLGVIRRRQRRYAEAEEILSGVLAVRQAEPKTDPVKVADAHNQLANVYWNQGRHEEAEAAHRSALEIRERALDINYPDIAVSLNNLGIALNSQSRWRESEPLLVRAVEIFSSSLGPDHPRTAASLNALATAQYRLGRIEEGERNYLKAIEIWTAAYGDAHPRTVIGRTSLAFFLQRQSRWREAVEQWRTIADLQQRSLGAEHRELARTLSRLGSCASSMADYATAESSLRRALEIQSRELSEEHTDTALTLRRLAWVLAYTGRFDEAERLLRRAAEMRARLTGPESRQALRAAGNLGWLMRRRGDLAAAEEILSPTLETMERVRGADSSDNAFVTSELGATLARQGRWQEAEGLLKRALELRDDPVGEESTGSATTLHELGLLARDRGLFEEARDYLERAVAIRRARLIDNHPDTVDTERALAALPRIVPGGR